MWPFASPAPFCLSRFYATLLASVAALAVLFATPVRAQDAAGADTLATESLGRFERDDPQRAQLFFSSTARPIGESGIYASSTSILFLEGGFGIGDAVSLRAGGAVVPDGDDAPVYMATVAPKVTVLDTKTSALFEEVPLSLALETRATAVRDIGSPSGRDWRFAVVPSVVGTYGSPEAALTAALGAGISDDGVNSPLVATVGGEVQALEWLKFITENNVAFAARQRFSTFYYDGEQIRGQTFEERSTIVDLMGGARFMWDRFSFEIGAGAEAGGAFNSNLGYQGHLRFSYRF